VIVPLFVLVGFFLGCFSAWLMERFFGWPATRREARIDALIMLAVGIVLFAILSCFACSYMETDIIGPEGAIVTDFRTCLYFSAVTFTTLGYGDFYPTEKAMPLAAFEAICDFIFFGFLVALTVYSLQQIGQKRKSNAVHKERAR